MVLPLVPVMPTRRSARWSVPRRARRPSRARRGGRSTTTAGSVDARGASSGRRPRGSVSTATAPARGRLAGEVGAVGARAGQRGVQVARDARHGSRGSPRSRPTSDAGSPAPTRAARSRIGLLRSWVGRGTATSTDPTGRCACARCAGRWGRLSASFGRDLAAVTSGGLRCRSAGSSAPAARRS